MGLARRALRHRNSEAMQEVKKVMHVSQDLNVLSNRSNLLSNMVLFEYPDIKEVIMPCF